MWKWKKNDEDRAVSPVWVWPSCQLCPLPSSNSGGLGQHGHCPSPSKLPLLTFPASLWTWKLTTEFFFLLQNWFCFYKKNKSENTQVWNILGYPIPAFSRVWNVPLFSALFVNQSRQTSNKNPWMWSFLWLSDSMCGWVEWDLPRNGGRCILLLTAKVSVRLMGWKVKKAGGRSKLLGSLKLSSTMLTALRVSGTQPMSLPGIPWWVLQVLHNHDLC